MPIPLYDLATAAGRAGFAQRLEQLQQTASAGSDAAKVVAQIIDEVRREGDEAVIRYMRKWTDPAFSAERIRVSESELAAAERGLDAQMRQAITQASHATSAPASRSSHPARPPHSR